MHSAPQPKNRQVLCNVGVKLRGRLSPNAIYFVAVRREPSGVANQKQREVPEGSRPAANKIHPHGVKKNGIGLSPAIVLAVSG